LHPLAGIAWPEQTVKQIIQHLKSGQTELAEIPAPALRGKQLLIRTLQSLVSAGTERMLVEFGRANLLDKARQQPERVGMVLDKVKTDGLLPTIEAVRNKLDQPLAMGYCNVGTVMAAGEGVGGFEVGDRVASNGKHAEVVAVSVNLCAKVPEDVSDEEAAFTVIGAIALQGIRLVQPTLGEAVVVVGLGLIGLMTVQLLRAQGCRVLGIDFDPQRLDLASKFGAEVVDLAMKQDPVAVAQGFSRGRGVDAVILTASTKSSEPMHQAALMCRKRGRIVLVGVAGLELSRADFFEKELSFQVSCSYGPGRYDAEYEEKGQDYPVGFVRWTEQRNFEAVLDMMASGRLDVKPLISHRFRVEEAETAYQLLGRDTPSLGILLQYRGPAEISDLALRDPFISLGQPSPGGGRRTALAFVGSGNYATAMLIPRFKETGARLRTVASSSGVSGAHAGRKFGFEQTCTDTGRIFADPEVDAIVVTTRHDSHASFVCQALAARKHVFVEKPLALNREELLRIRMAYAAAQESGWTPILMVGFNRRFAPQVQRMQTLLGQVREPKALVMTVNAGAVPEGHWTQDPKVGGGRIIGEACHFIDLMRCLVGAAIVEVQAVSMGCAPGLARINDRVSFNLTFADGSIGTVHYLANGHKSLSKERLEIFCAGRVLQLDNFRKLTGYGWPGFSRMNLWRQDKGQGNCVAAFVRAVDFERESPIPFEELVETADACFCVMEALERKSGIAVGDAAGVVS
jgi:predicted dehydrogenase/threonine dehydrogenase-like Zn-dependent dehydrogenase